MTSISEQLLAHIENFPRAGSAESLGLFMRHWGEAGARAEDPDIAGFVKELAEDEAGFRLLGALFGNSPYLSQSLIGDIGFARDLIEAGPDKAFDGALAMMRGDGLASDAGQIMQRLRIAKRRAALAVAMGDISGAWELEKVTGSLTRLAESALRAATAGLLAEAARAGELTLGVPDDPERDSGVIILGMGKLGAAELNYSSDIDLIILYEPDLIDYTGKTSLQQCFVRFARNLVKLMDERTSDGYVFRTDLRLRPDPGSTPPALSTLAAETYYESAGQNWERAAMIKARPVAGDIAAGQRFLDYLSPFIWRKNLDFAAIQDIHSIKRQINAHRGGAAIAVAGHNIKLGRGGIREIEFFAQTQQLIWGGRDPSLRAKGTCEAMRALVASGRVTQDAADDLERAYEFLRRLEHRLQMVDDRQTHSLPDSDDRIDAIGVFMGYPDGTAFTEALLKELRAVEECYARLFEESPDLGGPGNLVFTGPDEDPDTLKTLGDMGFRDPAMVSATIRGWHHGRYRAMRSAHARELLTELGPTILEAFSKTIDPDAALLKFDDFLGALPAGVQLFSLFHSNPGLFDLVAEIMGSAPRLAGWLSRSPILLDGVLTQGFFDSLPSLVALEAELANALTQARDFQDELDVVRRWNNDRIFQIGAQILQGRIDPDGAGRSLSDIADAGLRALFPAVMREFRAQHGEVPGGGMAVVAFGKLGGLEFTVGSDLDLLFVYDAPPGVEASDGPKPLPPALYFARLSQRFINAVTAPTGEGRLYEVDMRLRPAGEAGPIASALEAFSRYQRDDAWTWEHMALTRARVVFAPNGMEAPIERVILEALSRPRDADKLLADVADMRARIAREHESGDIWRIKHCRGGIVDIEFITQYLQLLHGAVRPEALSTNTTGALKGLADAGVIAPEIAEELIGAMRLWRNVQGMMRLSLEGDFDEESAPDGLRAALARSAGVEDFETLRGTMVETTERIHRRFMEIVETPAAELART